VVFLIAVYSERGFSAEELAASLGSKFPALPLKPGSKPGFSCDQSVDDESWECFASFQLEDAFGSDAAWYDMDVSDPDS